jgi:NAD(P)-dependent dehydrogenase (short-subunit alcohol dehydrogenase family)
LLSEYYDVFVIDQHSRSLHGAENYLSCDITNCDEVNKIFSEIPYAKYKDVSLINNAGITINTDLMERTVDEFELVFKVNSLGTFLCSKAFIKEINEIDDLRFKNKSIVNISSIYGNLAPDFEIYTDYSTVSPEIYGMSKASINQLTKYLAVYSAKNNIRVNAVAPGGIYNKENPQGPDFVQRYSARVPMGRMANLSDVTPIIKFLISRNASYITGQIINVDGGLNCW